jgi:hypothetical protein
MISDIYYDRPWELSSKVPEDIRNEYQYGEGAGKYYSCRLSIYSVLIVV